MYYDDFLCFTKDTLQNKSCYFNKNCLLHEFHLIPISTCVIERNKTDFAVYTISFVTLTKVVCAHPVAAFVVLK